MQSDKRWYITVGYPGGEFAVESEHVPAAVKLFAAQTWDCYETVHGTLARQGRDIASVRPAPPDLAEWLDFGPMWHDVNYRQKVPGGWLVTAERGYMNHNTQWDYQPYACTFIPVPLAAHITVLEDSNAG